MKFLSTFVELEAQDAKAQARQASQGPDLECATIWDFSFFMDYYGIVVVSACCGEALLGIKKFSYCISCSRKVPLFAGADTVLWRSLTVEVLETWLSCYYDPLERTLVADELLRELLMVRATNFKSGK